MEKILNLTIITIAIFFINPMFAKAYGECDQYGYMATYDSYTNSCSCFAGYSFGTNFLGEKTCMLDSEICKDKYGYNSTSDYNGSCKCNYGYGFGKNSMGKTSCVSYDSICEDKFGYHARYDSYTDTCECSLGYILRDGECTDGSSFCRSEHGMYSNYSSQNNKCGCDDGYTMDSDYQCVKKQNNVYFLLKELDTSTRDAIIQSRYDYRNYLVHYNTGCYSASFERYIGNNIVVNLGTDFDLDAWDKIVLQDDDEVCDITSRENVGSGYTFIETDEENNLTIEQLIAINNIKYTNIIPSVENNSEQVMEEVSDNLPEVVQNEQIETKPSVIIKKNDRGEIDNSNENNTSRSEEIIIQANSEILSEITFPWYKRIYRWLLNIFKK